VLQEKFFRVRVSCFGRNWNSTENCECSSRAEQLD